MNNNIYEVLKIHFSPPAIDSLKSKSNTQLLSIRRVIIVYIYCSICCVQRSLFICKRVALFDVYFIFEQNVKNKRKI